MASKKTAARSSSDSTCHPDVEPVPPEDTNHHDADDMCPRNGDGAQAMAPPLSLLFALCGQPCARHPARMPCRPPPPRSAPAERPEQAPAHTETGRGAHVALGLSRAGTGPSAARSAASGTPCLRAGHGTRPRLCPAPPGPAAGAARGVVAAGSDELADRVSTHSEKFPARRCSDQSGSDLAVEYQPSRKPRHDLLRSISSAL